MYVPVPEVFNLTGFSLYPENALIQKPLYMNQTDEELLCNSAELLRTGIPRGSITICKDKKVPIRDQLSTLTQVSDHLSGAIIIRLNLRDLEESMGDFTFPAVVLSPQIVPEIVNGNGFKDVVRSLKQLASAPNYRAVSDSFTHKVPRYCLWHRGSAGRGLPTRENVGPPTIPPDHVEARRDGPGVHVIAAWPPNLPAAKIGTQYAPLGGDFVVMSGTSMAAAVRSALMTTAKAKDKKGRPILDNADEYKAGEKPATPLTIGSGQIDADRALDPGLVYDISPQEYVDSLCNDFVDLSEEEIRAIVRRDFVCDFTSDQLNYPAFILAHRGSASVRTRARFVRTVTNVGMGPATYKAEVTAPKNLTVTVMPETLVFQESGERKSYRVDVTFTRELEDVVFGELVWAEQNGSHTVRSPIVTAARGNQTPLNSVGIRRYESAATL